MAPTPRPVRGFTLFELMVSIAASAIVISAALSLLGAQQRMFRLTTDQRGVQETARIALDTLSSSLRLAGYGLEPIYAFDFGATANLTMDRAPEGTTTALPGYDCAAAVTCRDAIDAPDELVFYARDSQWMRPVRAVGEGSITLAGPLAQPLHRGQILQVACFTAEMYWAFVTVAAEVPATASDTVPVALLPGVDADFGRQNRFLDTAVNPCFGDVFTNPAPERFTRAFLVNRYRYRIRSYDAAGAPVAWGAAGSRPSLVLDRGLVDGAGQSLEEVVAPDVEDLQVAYLFPRAATRLAGGTPGAQLANGAADIDLAPLVRHPLFSDEPENRENPAADPRRTHHPANIGAVQLTIVVRGASQESERTGDPFLPAAGNRPAQLGESGYRRSLFQTTVATPNLYTRGPHFPAYRTAADPELNAGGG